MEDNVQSLMVNQAMAAIASEYVAKLIIRRRITTFQTAIDLQTLSMRSTPVTPTAIRAAVDTFTAYQHRRAAEAPLQEQARAA